MEGYAENESGTCLVDESGIPTRACGATLRYGGPAAEAVFVAGEFNGWSSSATPMSLVDGVWTVTLTNLAPGDYAYKLVDKTGKNWRLDPNNPFTKYAGGAQKLAPYHPRLPKAAFGAGRRAGRPF